MQYAIHALHMFTFSRVKSLQSVRKKLAFSYPIFPFFPSDHPGESGPLSARIARGSVSPLSELKPGDVSAVVFPGGFGAAKNLSDFGFKVGNSFIVLNEIILKCIHSYFLCLLIRVHRCDSTSLIMNL